MDQIYSATTSTSTTNNNTIFICILSSNSNYPLTDYCYNTLYVTGKDPCSYSRIIIKQYSLEVFK